MDTDESLWNGMRQGKEDMFLELYNRHYHTLFFIGLKEISDAQLVKDTIQQLFLYLWEKKKSIHQAENVKSYLITSFLRKLTADWKKNNNRVAYLHVAGMGSQQDLLPTPEEELIEKNEAYHLSVTLADHVNELPNRQRELIFLRFYEGLSYEKIAEQTGLSQRTIYNSIHEALKKLRLEMHHPAKPSSLNVMVLLFIITLVIL